MPLTIIRNDITKMHVDAIVNAANNSLLGGGGVDGAIHSAAGPELLRECRTLGGCETGKAKLTGAYRLPCRYVIHTVGPIWNGGGHGERELLISCYTESLRIAEEHNCDFVAFPLISAGAYGYPKDQALRVAVDTIGGFLAHSDMTVYLVVYDKSAYSIGAKLFSDIASYIDDRYIDEHPDKRRPQFSGSFGDASVFPAASQNIAYQRAPAVAGIRKADQAKNASKRVSLDDALKQLDEGFTETLLRRIDERGMTDAECYKKANIDRKLFSKIRGDVHYRPSKQTALAFAIALELSIDETNDLLRRAGFALSHSSKFDIIIEYFIESGNYNIFEINEALFAFDQSLLGA